MKPIRQRLVATDKGTTNKNTKVNVIEETVEVYCRLRTNTDSDLQRCIRLKSPTQLFLIPIDDFRKKKLYNIAYNFNHIFTDHAKQKEVFEYIASPLISDLLLGGNGLLFTYGITGSGKTYTMTGDQNNPGIIPRCINVLFNTIGTHQTAKNVIRSDRMNGFELSDDSPEDVLKEFKTNRNKLDKFGKKTSAENSMIFINDGSKLEYFDENSLHAIFVSYTEIYNNSVYDLLDENTKLGATLQSKIVREDSRGHVYVNGMVELEVKSAKEAFELYHLGRKRKRMAQTNMNNLSSRSHSIFNIRVARIPKIAAPKNRRILTVGQLSLVDLAGSERCNRTQTSGQRLKEAGSINNSLMALRNCLEILRENQKTGSTRIVPYRDQRLTHLFKYFFDGGGKVKMIICVNPSMKDYDENVHVMKFAELSREVKLGIQELPEPIIPATRKIETANVSIQTESVEINIPRILDFPKFGTLKPETTEIIDVVKYLQTNLYQRSQPEFPVNAEDLRMKILKLQNEKTYYEEMVKHKMPRQNKYIEETKENRKEIEIIVDQLKEKNMKNDEIIAQLQNAIEEKNFQIRQLALSKAKHKKQLVEITEKITQDKSEKRQQNILNELSKKQEKINRIKEIISTENTVREESNSSEQVALSTPHKNREINDETYYPRRMAPVSNPRYRRSRSADRAGGWLKHTQVNPTPLGTVLQPYLKCTKSVSKLTNIKDVVNPKQDKYLLISQGQDEEGDLETKLYKGDIIPTCCGGAQVVFDDVENLKQTSPTSTPRKRSSSNTRSNEHKKNKVFKE